MFLQHSPFKFKLRYASLLLYVPFSINLPKYILICRRNRAIQEGTSPFSILPDTLVFGADSIRGNIRNANTNVTLVLIIEALQKNTARIRINELNPIRPRYECKDSLVKDPVRVR